MRLTTDERQALYARAVVTLAEVSYELSRATDLLKQSRGLEDLHVYDYTLRRDALRTPRP